LAAAWKLPFRSSSDLLPLKRATQIPPLSSRVAAEGVSSASPDFDLDALAAVGALEGLAGFLRDAVVFLADGFDDLGIIFSSSNAQQRCNPAQD
jgi:hypothetical protein